MEPDNVTHLRPSAEWESPLPPSPTWLRQINAMETYWSSKFGHGPTTATYMLFSVALLGALYLVATPWFTLHAVYKALRA